MVASLYETLGITPDATAYRRRAQKAHPDKEGGDADEFKRIQESYEVLSDPERRARYDADGTTDKASDPRARAIHDLSLMAVNLANQLGPHDDLIAKMRSVIGMGIAHHSAAVTELRRQANQFEKRATRILAKKGENFIAAALTHKATELRRQADGTEKEVEYGRTMVEMLSTFEYLAEQGGGTYFSPMFITHTVTRF